MTIQVSAVTAEGGVSASEGQPRFRLGTRGSALALRQSTTVADALRALGAEVELVTVRTAGDDRPPDTAWGEGAFVGALESALLDGRVDIAVHSAKDVPTAEPDGLVIAAYPRREDAGDALVGREPGLTVDRLARGARVGTDSPRRGAFVRALRPDVSVHPLHGNVDTRLRRLDEGETDALVLAVAGLTRLGRADRIGSVFPVEAVPPAPGQGALAVQCRADDRAALEWLSRLDDPATRAAVEAERAFLRATGGGCRAPIGAFARIEGDSLVLIAATAGTGTPRLGADGRPVVATGCERGPTERRVEIARALAARLTAELAGTVVDEGRRLGERPRVLVTRPLEHARELVAALEAVGLEAKTIPTIEIVVEERTDLPRRLSDTPPRTWIALTSANAVAPVVTALAATDGGAARFRWAAVGPSTAAALSDAGIVDPFVPSRADGHALAAELPLEPGDCVVLPRSEIADNRTESALRARGADVRPMTVYRTVEGPEGSRDALRAAFGGDGVNAIVFTSGSTVRGLLRLLAPAHASVARGAVACCIGPSTAAVAADQGFTNVIVSDGPSSAAIADAVRVALRTGGQEPRSAAAAGTTRASS